MAVHADVRVQWQYLPKGHAAWGSKRCLYAYLTPDKTEILYIGKCWGVTVRGRWSRAAKQHFWDDLERERGIHKHVSLYGEIELTYAGRVSHALIMDVESLLIAAEQPWGNIQCTVSRIARSQLIVECAGKWPGRARFYKDNA